MQVTGCGSWVVEVVHHYFLYGLLCQEYFIRYFEDGCLHELLLVTSLTKLNKHTAPILHILDVSYCRSITLCSCELTEDCRARYCLSRLALRSLYWLGHYEERERRNQQLVPMNWLGTVANTFYPSCLALRSSYSVGCYKERDETNYLFPRTDWRLQRTLSIHLAWHCDCSFG